MANNQHDARASDDDTTSTQTEESHAPEAAVATVARMLANPRRVRRN